MTEETLYKALRSVAASTFQPVDWDFWWKNRVHKLREVLTPEEFRRLNIPHDAKWSAAWMLSCQREVEAVLTARQVPFQHGTYYEEEAAREAASEQN